MTKESLKISCILTSYNRPRMIRHALKSIADQSYKNYELLIFDDSTAFDIMEVVKEFKFPSLQVHHTKLSAEERKAKGRLGVNCNHGLYLAQGDLVCFLCDDDYYYPDWFHHAAAFLGHPNNKDKNVVFGALSYSKNKDMEFPINGFGIWIDRPVHEPGNVLDHNQVVHRRFAAPFKWPEDFRSSVAPDATYFNSLARAGHIFYPTPAYAVVKRQHSKNLQNTLEEIGTEKGESLRE